MKRFFGSLVLEELGKESISIFQLRSPPDGSDVLGFPCGVSFESVEARQEVEGSRGRGHSSVCKKLYAKAGNYEGNGCYIQSTELTLRSESEYRGIYCSFKEGGVRR